jgi:hypothetical protein
MEFLLQFPSPESMAAHPTTMHGKNEKSLKGRLLGYPGICLNFLGLQWIGTFGRFT